MMRAVQLVEIAKPLADRDVAESALRPLEVRLRVAAAGICHSDAHYRSGASSPGKLPLALGHEVAGVIEEIGTEVDSVTVGSRVCLHYLVTCGRCDWCRKGNEQFCKEGQMLGKHRPGGYAETIVVPACNAFEVPTDVTLEAAALMMCSSATSLHALAKARLLPGETVAIFGAGGLGTSAIQLAFALGASKVLAVDIDSARLLAAEELGAGAIDACRRDAVEQILEVTDGRGVDVALELIGLPKTMQQAVQSLAIQGRAALVGITPESFSVSSYHELINKEAEIVGVSDHLASEIPQLLEWASQGKLDAATAITERVPLQAAAINNVLDRLEQFGAGNRAVIVPQ